MQSVYLADLVMPQEYGITSEEKTEVAFTICCPLLSKIQMDICNTLSDSGSDVMNRLDPKYVVYKPFGFVVWISSTGFGNCF